MKSKLTTNTYFLITHPDAKDLYVENYRDRTFRLYGKFRGHTIFDSFIISGNKNWDITEENILACANHILEKEIEDAKKEESIEKPTDSGKGMWDHFDDAFKSLDKVFRSPFWRDQK